MTTTLPIGAARKVVVKIVETDNTLAALAHDAAGIQVFTQVGEDVAVDRTSSLTDTPGDWYWRSLGAGLHELTIPESIIAEANVGKMLRVEGVATGVFPFSNNESYLIVDPAYVDEMEREIAWLAVTAFEYEIDTDVVPNTLTITDPESGESKVFQLTRSATGGPLKTLVEA